MWFEVAMHLSNDGFSTLNTWGVQKQNLLPFLCVGHCKLSGVSRYVVW